MRINSAKDLDVYGRAYALSMAIYDLSKSWPKEERYSLTDPIRRSSRSVCANLREAWSKRRYEAYFVQKLTECDGEIAETDTWLDYSRDGRHISQSDHEVLAAECAVIGRMLGAMLKNPKPFLIKDAR